MICLKGKVAIITGASSGIGKATAILFSKLGANVVVLGRDENALDETMSQCQSNVVKVVGDICDNKVREQLINSCVSNFGKLTTLVNNAAIFRLSSLVNTEISEYERVMDVNLRSVVKLSKLCVPYLIREKGSVVNVSSIAGSKSFPGLLPYAMSKAGLDQFSKCLALELADRNVRVNSVKYAPLLTI